MNSFPCEAYADSFACRVINYALAIPCPDIPDTDTDNYDN